MAEAVTAPTTASPSPPATARWGFPDLPNTPLTVVTIAFVLGDIFSLALLAFFVQTPDYWWWPTRQLAFFLASWSFFHFAEFATTAGWNTKKCSVDSFLLNNGWSYHIANLTGCLEYLVGLYFWPTYKALPYLTELGMMLTLIGQILRSIAMIHASASFSHSVQFRKAEDHKLVTTGVYGWFRHPSYAGFFYWSLGTQIVLQNPLSLLGFVVVLWRFFSHRIRYEEYALVRFFGQEYIRYRERVGTRIPFIP